MTVKSGIIKIQYNCTSHQPRVCSSNKSQLKNVPDNCQDIPLTPTIKFQTLYATATQERTHKIGIYPN